MDAPRPSTGTRSSARAAGLALALAAIPLSASAYVVLQTSTGKELHFKALPQDFFLAEAGSADIPGVGEFEAIVRAFETWDDVGDSDARFADFGVVPLGTADVFKDGGLPARDRKNLVVWVEDDWIEPPAQIAVTYSYFVEASGKILEDDITMNGVDYTWTAGDGVVATDVESIAAHEIGHAFGLGHSEVATATMFATASQGETMKRDLDADDIAAIRHLYPPGCCPHTRTQDALAFFGCSLARASAGRGGAVTAVTLGTAVALMVARRRRGRRSAAALAALLSLPFAGGTAGASVARALSLEEMARTAGTVVRGRVIWTQAMTLPGGAVVTVSEIEVEDVLAGDPPATLTVVEPGGEPGDTGIGLMVSGAARFETGEEVVLFAEPSRSAYARHFPDTVRPLAMSQAKFTVVREPGAPARVVRDLSGVARVAAGAGGGWEPVAGDELQGMTLDELVDRVVRAR